MFEERRERILSVVRTVCENNHKGLSGAAAETHALLRGSNGLFSGAMKLPGSSTLRGYVAFAGLMDEGLMAYEVVFSGDRPKPVVVTSLDGDALLLLRARHRSAPRDFSVQPCPRSRLISVVHDRGDKGLRQDLRAEMAVGHV